MDEMSTILQHALNMLHNMLCVRPSSGVWHYSTLPLILPMSLIQYSRVYTVVFQSINLRTWPTVRQCWKWVIKLSCVWTFV